MTACLGVDTGGTFTDFVLLDAGGVRIHKVLSTPEAPERAILQGIREMGLAGRVAAGELYVVHGTTVATNAALEGQGARTLFITNRGLEDLLRVGRQTRPRLYDLTPPSPIDALDPELMLGVDARLDSRGETVRPLERAELEALVRRVRELRPEAVAISLLFSYLDSGQEEAVAGALAGEDIFVCRSSDVLPVAGEYERGLATWLNAWLGPRVAAYIERLTAELGGRLAIMQSHGGTIAASAAQRRAVNLLLSGPAGGLRAAQALGETLGTDQLMTFDMGGTSTDVALLDGGLRLTREGRIGEWPVAVPMVDMHTIGAGGGSLARVDEAGLLHVGPRSAGADPGPACYGRGGTRAAVTDANLVLGRLQPEFALGGSLRLDRGAAHRALAALGEQLGLDAEAAARGVIDLANEHMAQALRVISIQKGFDPKDFTLVSFGGAGGLHVCALAGMLGMDRAVVPLNSGVLSARGLAGAPRQRELLQALPAEVTADIVRERVAALEAAGRAALETEGVAASAVHGQAFADLRYRGQSFHLDVPWTGDMAAAEADFHRRHEQRYGHRLSLPVEWVNVRVQLQAPHEVPALPDLPAVRGEPIAHAPVAGEDEAVPVYRRAGLGAGQALAGPALIREDTATTWLARNWRLRVHRTGHLLLERC